MGYFYADDYMKRKRYDPYSSIASDPELRVDEQAFKEFTPAGNKNSPQRKKKVGQTVLNII